MYHPFKITMLLLLLCGNVSAAESQKLNLLYIPADDMNADSPGWMGSKMGATPELDKLAATCHRFINNHLTQTANCKKAMTDWLAGPGENRTRDSGN